MTTPTQFEDSYKNHDNQLFSLLAPRNELKQVGPAEACRVTGWKDLPHVGDVIMEVSK